MADVPKDRRYTTSHEWAAKVAGLIVMGITDFAVQELGDLVFIDLPEVGADVTAGDPFGEIESVKAVSELNAPVSGKITEINTDLEEGLETIAESPYDDGWMIKIDPSDPAEYKQLMSDSEYAKKLAEEE